MRVEELFGSEAHDAIERAVQEAERRTSGEIVPVVVDRSDDYVGLRAGASAILAFAAGVIVLALPVEPALWVPPVELLTFVLGMSILRRRSLLHLLLPRSVCAEAVDRAARLAFLSHGLVETRDRTGILIYLSLLEHQVEVLADRGIDERVEPGTWDGVVETILSGIRRREAEQGLIDAIRTCGDILADAVPPGDDNPNELPNRLRS